MKCIILMGSPRKNGNTISLVNPFIKKSTALGTECELIWLYDKDIQPCITCRICQSDWTKFGCRYKDDVQEIFDRILAADIIVLATPIYSWY